MSWRDQQNESSYFWVRFQNASWQKLKWRNLQAQNLGLPNGSWPCWLMSPPFGDTMALGNWQTSWVDKPWEVDVLGDPPFGGWWAALQSILSSVEPGVSGIFHGIFEKNNGSDGVRHLRDYTDDRDSPFGIKGNRMKEQRNWKPAEWEESSFERKQKRGLILESNR